MKSSPIAYIVVSTQSVLALICVIAICMAMFYKNYADPSILSALIVLTGTIVGNLGSLLGGPRMPMPSPMKTEVMNLPENPVPVAPQPLENKDT